DHDAVLDQDGARGRRALVVHGQRAPAAGDRAVIDDGDAGRGDALADLAGEHRAALAVEVALEAMTDRLVQQHARPARAQHDIHLAGRAVDRLQIDQGLTQGFIDLRLPALGRDPDLEAGPPAGAGRGALAAAVLLDGDRDVQSD